MSTTTLEPVTAEDLPACFSIFNDAFDHSLPFVEILYPNHGTPAGDAQAISRLKLQLENNPNAKYIAAKRDGKIVGWAIWVLMYEPPGEDIAAFEDMDQIWPRLEDQRYVTQLWKEFVQPRRAAVRDGMAVGKPTNVLVLLCVQPQSQRQGVGEDLVRWGTDLADREGIEAVVESSRIARRTYEKCGFKVAIEKMRYKVDEEFSDRETPDSLFLRRSPVSQ